MLLRGHKTVAQDGYTSELVGYESAAIAGRVGGSASIQSDAESSRLAALDQPAAPSAGDVLAKAASAGSDWKVVSCRSLRMNSKASLLSTSST